MFAHRHTDIAHADCQSNARCCKSHSPIFLPKNTPGMCTIADDFDEIPTHLTIVEAHNACIQTARRYWAVNAKSVVYAPAAFANIATPAIASAAISVLMSTVPMALLEADSGWAVRTTCAGAGSSGTDRSPALLIVVTDH